MLLWTGRHPLVSISINCQMYKSGGHSHCTHPGPLKTHPFLNFLIAQALSTQRRASVYLSVLFVFLIIVPGSILDSFQNTVFMFLFLHTKHNFSDTMMSQPPSHSLHTLTPTTTIVAQVLCTYLLYFLFLPCFCGSVTAHLIGLVYIYYSVFSEDV